MTYQRRSSSHRQKKKKPPCSTLGHIWARTTIPTVRTCTRERCRAVSRLVRDVWTTTEQESTPVQHMQAVTSINSPVEQLGVSWSSGTLRPASARPDHSDLQAGYILPSKEEERRLEQEYYNLSRYY